MGEVSIIGLDLAKNVFQAHGAGADGRVVFRRKLTRAQLLKFMAAQPPCVVAMEACASSHHWGRVIGDLGHEVRLIPPAYVKPFAKRQKNDMADAEAIAEAASRPTMRFVAVKSEAQQAAAMAYRTRDLLVRQRTQTINALRAHLAEQGIVAPTGPAHVGRLAAIIDGGDGVVPAAVRELARLLSVDCPPPRSPQRPPCRSFGSSHTVDELRGDQAHFMPDGSQGSRPMVSRSAGFHRSNARGVRLHEREELACATASCEARPRPPLLLRAVERPALLGQRR